MKIATQKIRVFSLIPILLTFPLVSQPDQELFDQINELRPELTQQHLSLKHENNSDNVVIEEQGNTFVRNGKSDQAVQLNDENLALDQNNLDALLGLAKLYGKRNEFAKAVENYKRILEFRPKHLHANFQLGYTYYLMGQLEESINTFQNILRFSPNCINARCNLAHILRHAGRINEAIEQYKKILKVSPRNPHVHYGYAECLLKAGKFEHGWKEFEYRWKRGTDIRNFSENLWNGNSDLAKKTILVRAEYGHGDTIQFIRFTKLLKEMGATVIAEVHGALHKLLSSCPYLDQVIIVGQPLPEFDMQIPLMSLPYLLGITNEKKFTTNSYIHPDQETEQYWKSKLKHDKNFKIGICWEGSTYYDSLRAPRSKKALHLHEFQTLSELPNVSLYSLQKTNARNQIHEVDFEVRDLGPDFDKVNGSYMDTAALMKTLDLIVTVDTSVAHLAGALGAPVFVILPSVADWRWMLNRDDTPWYATMRLFRQKKYGEWNTVFAEIKRIINKKLQDRIKKSNIVTAEISIGELIDKITILQLKNKYIKNKEKLKNIWKELEALCKTRDTKIPKCKELDELTQQLYDVNQQLWNIEDACRNKERLKEFDDEFIQITRSVYINNDERCAIKHKINVLLGSNLIEEKSYAAY